jgi:hypothetical protein
MSVSLASVLSHKFANKNLPDAGSLFGAPSGAEDISPGREPWVGRPSPRLRHPSPARAGEGMGEREGSHTHPALRDHGLPSSARSAG